MIFVTTVQIFLSKLIIFYQSMFHIHDFLPIYCRYCRTIFRYNTFYPNCITNVLHSLIKYISIYSNKCKQSKFWIFTIHKTNLWVTRSCKGSTFWKCILIIEIIYRAICLAFYPAIQITCCTLFLNCIMNQAFLWHDAWW